MTRGEILDEPERRRRWSEDEKTAILAELARPEATGAEIARRHGVSCGLPYTSRKERRANDAVSMPFAPILLTGPERAADPPAIPPMMQSIEIEMKGARIRHPGDSPPSTAAAAIKALRGRS